MPFLKPVDVNDALVDRLWKSLEGCGSFYSIADGFTKEHFRKVLFASSLVLEGPNILVRLEDNKDYAEVHPIVFGPSLFSRAEEALGDVMGFAKKPVCCIIPKAMRGARKLALAAGMRKVGDCQRQLSGVPVVCEVWRK